jgi:hypothetical protein
MLPALALSMSTLFCMFFRFFSEGFFFSMSFTAGLSRGSAIKGDSQLVVTSDSHV